MSNKVQPPVQALLDKAATLRAQHVGGAEAAISQAEAYEDAARIVADLMGPQDTLKVYRPQFNFAVGDVIAFRVIDELQCSGTIRQAVNGMCIIETSKPIPCARKMALYGKEWGMIVEGHIDIE